MQILHDRAREADDVMATEDVVIASMLAELQPGAITAVLERIACMPGIEAHGMHGSSLVVSIEAPSINAAYAAATELSHTEGVLAMQLVYANFEDDPLIKARLGR